MAEVSEPAAACSYKSQAVHLCQSSEIIPKVPRNVTAEQEVVAPVKTNQDGNPFFFRL